MRGSMMENLIKCPYGFLMIPVSTRYYENIGFFYQHCPVISIIQWRNDIDVRNMTGDW